MNTEIKQVVFDLGAVLIEWNPQRIIEMVTSDVGIQNKILEDILLHPDWLELDKGSFSEEFASRKISARSDLNQSFIMDVFDTVRTSFYSIDETKKILETLVENHIPCYALSNMSVENYQYLCERHSFFEHFSGVVISGHEKMIKPDEEIFKVISKRYQLDLQETLLIDDTLVNCKAAERLGFRVLHFKRNRSHELLSILSL